MRGITEVGGVLRLVELPDPTPGPGQVRLAVRATAVNRADLVQRSGHYPPPPGASPLLGLEAAGFVESIGPGVTRWREGDRVCALLTGGGYASRVVVHEDHLLPAGDLPFEQAGALPEALCTVHDALIVQAGLRPGERVVLHAGGSGIGTTAIQLCREHGSPCLAVVGSDEKASRCVALGADAAWNRHHGPWTESPWVAGGVDVVLDPVGGTTFEQGVAALRSRGRLIVLGLLGGRRATLDLGRVLVQRLSIVGTVLRSRSDPERAEVVRRVADGPWDLVIRGAIRPALHAVLPLDRADEAHRLVAADRTFGKVALTVVD